MTTDKKQSAIAEVRDQLSLDFADGKYLNRIGYNLGMRRPVYGFTNDQWRALIKVLALQYKQIVTKFQDALEIVLGPRITKVFTLSDRAYPDDTVLRVNSTVGLPQTGTLVLDVGLVTEEEVPYCYIDRESDTIYLNDILVHTHEHSTQDVETDFIVTDSTATSLVVADARFLPTTFPFTMLVGAGTALEESVSVSGVDVSARTVTLSSALASSAHALPAVSSTSSTMLRKHHTNSLLLALADTSSFSESGLLTIGRDSQEFTATTASTTTSATIASPSFVDNELVGLYVFFPNVGASLRAISSNTSTVITFSPAIASTASGETFVIRECLTNSAVFFPVTGMVLHAFPATNELAGYKVVFEGNITAALAGKVVTIVSHTSAIAYLSEAVVVAPNDLFSIMPVVKYGSNDQSTNSLLLTQELPSIVTVLQGAVVEEMTVPTKVSLAPGQVTGTDWDIIQAEARRVEIFIPEVLKDIGDTRSASYLHTAHIATTPSTTLTSPVVAGATSLPVASTANFPLAGVLTIGAERVAYYVASATALTIPSSSTLSLGYPTSTTVSLYQPRYGTTDLLEGNVWSVSDTFSCPYLYNEVARAPSGTVGISAFSSASSYALAGPTEVASFCALGSTAVEVADASAFPLAGFPINMLLGEGTANVETAAVTEVLFKNRTYGALIAAPGFTSSANTLQVDFLDPQTATPSGGFPNAGSYRVKIDAGGTPYVVTVTGTATSPDRLVLDPTSWTSVPTFSPGHTVELLHDVVKVNGLANSHNGLISFTDRSVVSPVLYPGVAETARVLYSSMDVVSGTGFPASGSPVYINFGSGSIPVSSTLSSSPAAEVTTLSVTATASFPIVYPYTVVLDKGTAVEELVHVSNNNTSTNTLTLAFQTRYAHVSGAVVTFTPGLPETTTYTTLSSNTLNFSTAIKVDSTHFPSENVIVSSGLSTPGETGYDFPLRLPSDIAARLSFLFDFIRAAGVKVSVIHAR